jgi:competence protein ComEC
LSVLREFPTLTLYASLASSDTFQPQQKFTPCLAGQRWVWDGVVFQFLYPSTSDLGIKKTNDRACVLKVSAKSQSALLTADIEAYAESALVGRGADLGSSLMSMPHHGSSTSSTPAFVAAVAPQQVFINAGYLNRFGHPDLAVLARYQGMRVSNTAVLGAIAYQSTNDGWQVAYARQQRRRYWHA